MKKFIAFFEIPASDFRRAVDFYETVLGVKLSVFECEGEKMACFTEDGETIGSISYTTGFRNSLSETPIHFDPSAGGILISFNCEAIEPALERVIQKGGKVIIPKTKIDADGKGWFAVFTDSEGNRVGFYADR